MKNLREKIAVLFAARGMFRVFCLIRGNHLGLKQVGRCLACGVTSSREPKLPPLKVTEFHPIQSIAAHDETGKRRAFIRNAQTREESRRYGY